MKKLITLGLAFVLVLGTFSFSAVAEAATRVKGYIRSNGTYVAPHYRSSPNRTKIDNYGTKGNYNPYTGKSGTRSYR